MASLSKSKVLAYRQCPRRLWLETHRPALRSDSRGAQLRLAVGNQIGDLARHLYDPHGTGVLVAPRVEGIAAATRRTTTLLADPRPVFEAGFDAAGGLAFADVMLPVTDTGTLAWRMIEVKSSAGVKEYHLDDAAVQAYVARAAGVALVGVAIAHIDNTWVYRGDQDFDGLLVEHNITEHTLAREADVRQWIAGAAQVTAEACEPTKRTGAHCSVPHACGFLQHCRSAEPVAQFPVTWLPGQRGKALKEFLETSDVIDLQDVPDTLLNGAQLRVKQQTVTGTTFFDQLGAADDLAGHAWPAYFLDFETIQFTMPIWAGTRPFEQIPFQFSVHVLSDAGVLLHDGFLETSGDDPSRPFAEALVRHCGQTGPVFVYNAGFETARIREVAARFPDLENALLSINERIVDLLPVARRRYYHPGQEGSWSIKKVLPAIAPDLSYEALDGVQDGGLAMEAFQEAIATTTTPERRATIGNQLHAYCELDTYAMVRIWMYFTGYPASGVAARASLRQ
jgi:hypothetical protein